MLVLTANLLTREWADGAARRAAARSVLAELRPDVLALQEVGTGADVEDLLGPGFSVVAHPGSTADSGAVLAGRWPVGRVWTLDLRGDSPGVLPWAAAVAVEVWAPEPIGPVLFVHHKPSWQLDREGERERQAVAVARFVAELVAGRPHLPVVLLGDFDAGPDAASIRFLIGRQSLDGMSVRYEDAWAAVHPHAPGHTFTPLNPLVRAGEMPLERGRRIDHVMVRSGAHGPLLDVVSCRLVFEKPVDGVWVSDHFGVLAELGPPPHPPGSWAG